MKHEYFVEDRLTLLVVGGQNSVDGFKGDTEAVDLSGNEMSCPAIGDYPFRVQEIAVFYDGDTPVGCGGFGTYFTGSGDEFVECYGLIGKNRQLAFEEKCNYLAH